MNVNRTNGQNCGCFTRFLEQLKIANYFSNSLLLFYRTFRHRVDETTLFCCVTSQLN